MSAVLVTPPLVVQTLRTQWTKRSRGAPLAARRNATPEVLDLPAAVVAPGGSEAIWHDVTFVEPEFAGTERLRWTDLAGVRVAGLDLVAEPAGRVRVDLFGKRQFTLCPGETGAVVYNWVEDVLEDGWRASLYHKVSAHLACGVAWSPTLFRAPPSHASRAMRDLA